MGKLTDVSVKYFGRTLGSSLESVKKASEFYKNDPSTIDDPNSLDELWKWQKNAKTPKKQQISYWKI